MIAGPRRKPLVAVLAVVMIACLSACTSSKETNVSGMTPQQSKARALAMEQEIAGRLPKDAVVSVDPSRGGTLISCAGDGVYSRAAGVTIHIAEGTDPATLLPALAESYSSDTRFQVRDVDSDYRYAIQLSGEYAEGYVIGTTGGEHALVVDSFSPCFELPPTMSPFDDF